MILRIARQGAPLLAALALASCHPVEADRLYALPQEAGQGAVVAALPLRLKAGGGHVAGAARFAELELDTDAVHKVAASCHHGPPVTSPVPLQVRAAYDDRDLVVEVSWRDATRDLEPLAWEREPEGWRLGAADEDGVAILWSRGGGRFGCQEACHMSGFAVRDGTVVDLRSMRLAGPGASEEVWVWKSAAGARELILGERGFLTAGGESFRRPNSAVAADESLRTGARAAAAYGEGDRPVWNAAGDALDPGARRAPAYLHAPPGPAPLLAAEAEHRRGWWRVTFRRRLEAGEGRQRFSPGERYRFGLAIFDSTSTDHHLVRDKQLLELVVPKPDRTPAEPGPAEGPGVL